MGQLQDEDYVADVVPTTSQSDSNKEIDDGPLPTSSEVINALALVRRNCVNTEGCGLSCTDSLDNVEACVLSQAAKSLKQKKIQDYFVPNTASSSKDEHPQLDEKANPYLSMSSEQLLEMDREVEDECSSNDDEDNEENDKEQITENAERRQDESSQDSTMLGEAVRNNSDTESSAESLSGGECPRGWRKRRRRKRGRECLTEDEASQPPKFPRSELPEDSDRSNSERSTDEWSNASIGSVDEEMAAAVEREFLGL
ncbi:hypothetical protein HPB49_005556 [Dermacentor silvarum]|uniref:Uncharacterized protein n=1 Tax=Dermacentor silvarum TaxID=543639 RepID=A0ACB8CQ21_DERSI|nr:hypothetical protein HPB49_005556 [Dermacentor silvarum]